MDLYKKYQLTPIINACGKLTRTSNARVLPEIAKEAWASLDGFYDADELMAAASKKIAAFSGAQAGFVTACCSSGLTLSAAACMTGTSLRHIEQLPTTKGLKNKVLMQKGHSVNFGAPVEQMIRLSGATICEVGSVNGTSNRMLESGMDEDTAAVLFVVSHHTARYGCVNLTDTVKMAHRHGIPVIVDASAQCFHIKKLVQTGADLIVCSGHKYLSGTVSGLVCGKADLIEAVTLQNLGIGRAMKVGKEGIFGLLAAIDIRMELDHDAFYHNVLADVQKVTEALSAVKGVQTSVTDDPNGNPFCRARVTVDPTAAGIDAAGICMKAAAMNPSIRLRDHRTDEGYFDVDTIELTEKELTYVIESLIELFHKAQDRPKDQANDQTSRPQFSWL